MFITVGTLYQHCLPRHAGSYNGVGLYTILLNRFWQQKSAINTFKTLVA